MKQNPRAGDRRVRATLKTFKKNYRDEPIGAAAGCRDIHGNIIGARCYGVNLNERIKILLDENVKQRSVLKEKTYELEALTYKYRKIQNMVQSGQYLQALNTTAAASTSLPTTTDNLNTNQLSSLAPLKSRSPTQGSFSPTKDESIKLNPAMEQSESIDGKTKSEMRKSPLTSSTTQLTTTNTTSSTNNTTESTADYSSSKIMSNENATSSTNGGCFISSNSTSHGKRALVAFDCPVKDGRLSEASDKRSHYLANITNELSGSSNPQPIIINYSKYNSTDPAPEPTTMTLCKQATSKKPAQQVTLKDPHNQCSQARQSPKCTTDSSYCSMGAEYELSGLRKSQNDLDLFTVFSYIANNDNKDSGKSKTENDSAANTFSRWSEGPFCTLMVKNNKSCASKPLTSKTKLAAPGSAILHKNEAEKEQASLVSEDTTTRVSYPNFGTKTGSLATLTNSVDRGSRKSLTRRQTSQQSEELKVEGRSGLQRKQLPRTISMIEYLGLNEFDMIARRHDKLLTNMRRKLEEKQQELLPCCYELSVCTCCASGESQSILPQDGRARSCQHIQSERDVEPFSSTDFLNSGGELVQSSSRMSCSTCCSLATQTFASHSEIYDETTRSSVSSPTATSSASVDFAAQTHRYPKTSPASSGSSSIDQESQRNQQPAAYCSYRVKDSEDQCTTTPIHNKQLLAHAHHPHHHHSSEQVSTTSTTSSILQNRQQHLGSHAKHSRKDYVDRAMRSTEQLNLESNPQTGSQAAAQVLHQDQQTTSERLMMDCECDHQQSTSKTAELTDEEAQQRRKLFIECDVLENL